MGMELNYIFVHNNTLYRQGADVHELNTPTGSNFTLRLVIFTLPNVRSELDNFAVLFNKLKFDENSEYLWYFEGRKWQTIFWT